MAARRSYAWGALALALVVLAAFSLLSDRHQDDQFSAYKRDRKLQDFSFGTRTSFPDNLVDMDSWIHYGIYVGIVGAVMWICGIIISISMCCGFCCRRCCCNFSKKGSRTCWTILFLVIFIAMCILCVLGIAFTVTISSGLSRTKNSVVKLADEGVPGAFDNVVNVILPLSGELRNIINETLKDVIQYSFQPVYELIDFANEKLDQSDAILGRASDMLNQTDASFTELRRIFTVLKKYESMGYISGVPDNSTVPDVHSQTQAVMKDARDSVSELGGKVGNLSRTVEDTIATVTDNSTAVRAIYQVINDTTTGVINMINGAKSSFQSMNLSKTVNDYYNKWVPLINSIRVAVFVVLLIMPMALYGLWLVGPITGGRYRCMLVGFWWAASVCWLMMLFAFIHIVLYVPMNDVCNQRDDLIRTGATNFVFTNGSNYASSVGLTSPAEAALAINQGVGIFLDKPDVLLDCKGEESIVTNLRLNIPAILDLSGRFDNATADIRAQVDKLNITGQVNETQPIFSSMSGRIADVAGNVTFFNESLTNYSKTHDDFASLFHADELWNATTEAEAASDLDYINQRTSTYPLTPRTFTYDDIDEFNSSDYPLVPLAERNEMDVRQNIVEQLVLLNTTVREIKAEIINWGLFVNSTDALLSQADNLLKDTSAITLEAWSRVNASLSLPKTILDSVFGFLDIAIAKAEELAKLEDLGKCKFLGDFMRQGYQRGLCTEIGRASGGLGICIVLLAFLWFFSWPIILSSKTHFAMGPSKDRGDSDYFEVEMTKLSPA